MTGRTTRGPVQTALRTGATLALLQAALPANLAVTAAASVAARLLPAWSPRPAGPGRTIMISGGKMTKALQLARSFSAAGHRVVLVEAAKYRWTGHRFSRAVDAFHVVPPPQADGYTDALVAIARREGVDVYVPVCSPAASYYDAVAKKALEEAGVEVLHPDPDVVERLDDKYAFTVLARSLGLTVPDTHLITDPKQVLDFDFGSRPASYVLKSIPYDPVHRLDLTPLPRPTRAETEAFVGARNITEETPWILQEFVAGTEYCTHSTVRDGRVQVYCCSDSSAFQINYASVDKPEIKAWVTRFLDGLGATGQISFDFLQAEDGRVVAIECNPRTHSAITMFYNSAEVAAAYLEDGHEPIEPLPTSHPTYWLYHEVWRMLADPRRIPERLRVIAAGKEAIFDWSDPLPFLLVHHLQIPSLLLRNLRAGKDWIRIDFNIGKLVEAAGD